MGVRRYSPYINKIKAVGADVVFFNGFGQDTVPLVEQARAQGLNAPFPFVTTYAGAGLVELGDVAVGIYTASEYSMSVDSPENKVMIAKYNSQHKFNDYWQKWPETGSGAIILGWQMVFAAVEKAGSVDPEKIIEAFEGFRYKTPVGWWTMRKCDHQVITPIFGMVIREGPNPFFSSPWFGPDIVTFSAEETAIPATTDYNPRCP
jgi:ABC-type branched-subunit amino acid transport system substrate-binding protein